MSRLYKSCGALLVAAGLAAVVACAVVVVGDQSYARAALAHERNPGNVLYEAEFKAAQAERAFVLIGGGLGALLALNGATLVGLGFLAGRRRPAD